MNQVSANACGKPEDERGDPAVRGADPAKDTHKLDRKREMSYLPVGVAHLGQNCPALRARERRASLRNTGELPKEGP